VTPEDPEEQDPIPAETLAEPELRRLCAASLNEWITGQPDDTHAKVDELVLEAQVLLMCEAIMDGQVQHRRMEPVFQQLIKGEINQTVTRPAKSNKRTDEG
tara:strand:- start:24 stop:326 length:303 start_codon:yes stop_codon:yes gene_type:complete